ncbi:MAG: serine acetyltransferase [Synechococcales bacterium]|nr:serine acetyltransferase [Synechococcales bacterium]
MQKEYVEVEKNAHQGQAATPFPENLPIISATQPDWSREQLRQWWDPGRQMLKSIRQYQKWQIRGGLLGYCFCKLSVIQHRFWSVAAGTDIPLNARLGGGFVLNHPNGIVIHPEASFGPNCLVLQQVTVVKDVTIGGHVDIGAGAKIIRPVTIGDHAKIGANAVVTRDVPPGATAVGIPARIIHQTN